MNDSITLKVKKFGPKVIKLSDDKEYSIKTDDDQSVTFKDDKGDDEKEIKVKIKKKDEADEKYQEKKLKVKYEGSWWTHGVKVSSKDIDGMSEKLKEEKEVSLGVKGVKGMFWVVLVSIIVVFAGLIWWWFASSRKEDKEEEGL